MPTFAMDSPYLDPRRKILCSRQHADNVAFAMHEATGQWLAVERTDCPLQPYRVVPGELGRRSRVEMQIIAVS